ncbi:hypothetical protein ACH5RR_036637 [Cinchona calisaya]|uniref:Chlororespiratory reduction 41 n=1 Tax=Cinchona calisaya TaxID=153742 RepID=A0ABD2Y987_9GENT
MNPTYTKMVPSSSLLPSRPTPKLNFPVFSFKHSFFRPLYSQKICIIKAAANSKNRSTPNTLVSTLKTTHCSCSFHRRHGFRRVPPVAALAEENSRAEEDEEGLKILRTLRCGGREAVMGRLVMALKIAEEEKKVKVKEARDVRLIIADVFVLAEECGGSIEEL